MSLISILLQILVTKKLFIYFAIILSSIIHVVATPIFRGIMASRVLGYHDKALAYNDETCAEYKLQVDEGKWTESCRMERTHIADISMAIDDHTHLVLPHVISVTLERNVTYYDVYQCHGEGFCLVKRHQAPAGTITQAVHDIRSGSLTLISSTHNLIRTFDSSNSKLRAWIFQWPTLSDDAIFAKLAVIPQGGTFNYILMTLSDKGVAHSHELTGTKYIPDDYVGVVSYLGVYWRRDVYDGLIKDKPLFVLATSFKQVIVVYNNSVMCCLQFFCHVNDISIIQTTDYHMGLLVRCHGDTAACYKVPLCQSQATDLPLQPPLPWKSWPSIKHITKGDFLAAGNDQYLLIEEELFTSPIIDKYVITDMASIICNGSRGEKVNGANVTYKSQVTASQALQLKKMRSYLSLEEKSRQIAIKQQLLKTGLKTLHNIASGVSTPTIRDNRLMNVIPGGDGVIQDTGQPIVIPQETSLSLIDYWQTIVDNDTWCIGLILKGIGIEETDDLSVWLHPSGELSVIKSHFQVIPGMNDTSRTLSAIGKAAPDESMSHHDTNICAIVSTCQPLLVDHSVIVMSSWIRNDKRHYTELARISPPLDDIFNNSYDLARLPSLKDLNDVTQCDDPYWRDGICHLHCKMKTKFTYHHSVVAVMKSKWLNHLFTCVNDELIYGVKSLHGIILYVTEEHFNVYYKNDYQLHLMVTILNKYLPDDVKLNSKDIQ